jgi:hypothetical protein
MVAGAMQRPMLWRLAPLPVVPLSHCTRSVGGVIRALAEAFRVRI